jgi:hypothetical protein
VEVGKLGKPLGVEGKLAADTGEGKLPIASPID